MRRDDDDERILKDKKSMRVPLLMMDAAAQHRPGFRTASDSSRDVKSERNAAYAAYDEAVTSAYRNPLGGGGSDNPQTGFGSSGPRGSAVGDPCTLNGWPGRLVAGEGGKLVCRITSRHDATKKQKRDPQGREAGTEEFEEDSVSIKDAFNSLAQRFGLVDDEGEASWDDLIRICRQMNEFNGNGDDDVDRIVRSYSTHTESNLRRDVPDAKKIAATHSDKMSGVYGTYDREIFKMHGVITIDQKRTATHEAAHAIIGRILNLPCGRVSIVPNDRRLGHAVINSRNPAAVILHWQSLGKHRSKRSAVRASILMRYAGSVCEQLYFGNTHGGERRDLQRIEAAAQEHGISDRELVQLQRMTRLLVLAHRDKIQLLAELLLTHKLLTGPEIDKMVFNKGTTTMSTNKTNNTIEARIASALSNGKCASTELYALIGDVEIAISNSDEAAKVMRLNALDLLTHPDANVAREKWQAAEFGRDRLRAALPKLKVHLEHMLDGEYYDRWSADFSRAEKKRDVAAKKFVRANELINELVALCHEAVEADKLIFAVNNSAPSGASRRLLQTELHARNLQSFSRDEPSLLNELKLMNFEGHRVWPPFVPIDVEKFAPKEPFDERYTANWWKKGSEAAQQQAVEDEAALQQADAERKAFYGQKTN